MKECSLIELLYMPARDRSSASGNHFIGMEILDYAKVE